jgi:hypothetical protein
MRSNGDGTVQVIDFGEARAQRIQEKRRNAERIFFKQILWVYCVVGSHNLRAVEMIDVSEEGCAFQAPFNPENPWPDTAAKELPIRLYFNQDTYVPVYVTIQNSHQCIEKGQRYVRYGCTIDKTVSSYETFRQFVRFLKLYSEHAHQDADGLTLFYI